MTATAASLSASLASSVERRSAARASLERLLDARRRSPWRAPRRAPAARSASRDLNTACAASKRLAGIGREQRQAAERRLDRAAQPVVDARPCSRSAGASPATGCAGRRVDAALPASSLMKTFLSVGAEQQPAVLQRLDASARRADCRSRRPRRSPSSVSLKPSAAKLGERVLVAPACARAARPQQQAERQYERDERSQTVRIAVSSRHWRRRRRRSPPPPVRVRRQARVRPLPPHFLVDRVVVAALQRDPVGLEVLASPAGSPTRRRPAPGPAVFHTTSNWPSAADLADEHRLGDVVVRQHLRRCRRSGSAPRCRAARRSPCRDRSIPPSRPPSPTC